MSNDELVAQEEADNAGRAAFAAKLNEQKAKDDDDLIAKLTTRVKGDADFAYRASRVIQDSKLLTLPDWMEAHDLFEATIRFTRNDTIRISCVSFGARIKATLSTRMLRMRQELDRSEKKIGPLIKEGRSEEVDPEALEVRNRLIGELGVAQIAETVGGSIISGEGRFANVGQLPGLLKKGDDASFKKAIEITEELPQKVIDTIGDAIRLLNSYGIEDKITRGN